MHHAAHPGCLCRFRRGCQREEWLGQRRHAIAQEDKFFATTKEVTEGTGKNLNDGRCCFGNPLDDADSQDTGSQR